MATLNSRPVIFLAFANSSASPLLHLAEEVFTRPNRSSRTAANPNSATV